MRNITKLMIATAVGIVLMSTRVGAAERTSVLMLKGKSCASHPKEITDALMGVKGVKAVDLNRMKGHAVVAYDGTVKPETLVDSLKKLKGSEMGKEWSCDAEVMD